MPKTTLAGHPLHPMIVTAPLGLLPFSLAMDVAHRMTGNDTYAEVAYHALLGGVVTGAAAAAAGFGDYLEIPRHRHTKKIAALHGSLNLAVLGVYGANLLARRRRKPPTGDVPLALSALGAAGLAVSAWYGGHLVYEHGLRVKGGRPLEGSRELRLPGDTHVEEAARSVR